MVRRRSRRSNELVNDFIDVLPRRFKIRPDALDLFPHIVVVEVLFDDFELAVIVGLFPRTATGNDRDLSDIFVVEQPVRDVDHNVPHTNDGDSAAQLEMALTERRQLVVVIDDVFGVIDAGELFARKTEFLGALRARGNDNRAEPNLL